MKKKALWKDIWIEIWNNKARFLALFAIILLGVGFFGGIKATGPNMLDTADQYYADYKLFDLKVLSNFGIEEKDVEVLNEIEDIKATPMRTIDIDMQEEEFLVKLYPLQDEKESPNQYAIISGRLPEKSGEITLDANQVFESKFKVGDMIRFNHEIAKDEEDTEGSEIEVDSAIALEEQAYKVVGFVNSPVYIDRINRGNTQVGKGNLDGFGVVFEEDIYGEIYTETYVQVDVDENLIAYTNEYDDEVESKKEEIELALNGRPLERVNEIRAEGKKEIRKADQKLEDAKEELSKAEKELQEGREELDEGQKEYNQQKQEFDEKIADAEVEIAQQQQTIDDGWADYQAGLATWEGNAKKYADAKAAWQIQKESLLQQVDSAISIEALAQNPIPGEEGKMLAQSIQELLDGEAAIEDAKAQMKAHQKTLNSQEVQLEEAQVTLDEHIQQSEGLQQQITAEKEALQMLEEQIASAQLESRQIQLDTAREFLSEKLEELTEERIDEMRGVWSGFGESSPLYQPILQYLDGSLPAADMQGLVTTESNELQELQAVQGEIDRLKASIANNEAIVQQLDVEVRQATLLENGQALEVAKNKLTEQVQALESQEQKLQQARNILLSEVQTAMQGVQEQIAGADAQFSEQGAALEAARTKLEAASNELKIGQEKLDQGKAELANQKAEGETALAEALNDIQKGEADYQEGFNEFEEKRMDAEKEIADGQVEINKATSELMRLDEPIYFVQDRSVNPGYQEYQDNANRMSAIASIFPVFFFMIAALVSFTTMTRMVDEQRQQMGTLKGLGYGNIDIAQKFLVYSIIAGVAGTIFGLIFGYNLFPTIIYRAYGSLYNLPDIRIHYYLSYALIAFLIAMLCTVGPSILATTRTLRENPASLMRPKAPKIGKRVFLERFPFIWSRLGFNAKITVRNLVRYKARNSMTIFGVAGCTALILTGFALKDSISGLAETQFGDVMKYQAVVALKPDQTTSDLKEYDEIIAEYSEINNHLHVLQSAYKVEKEGVNLQDVTVFVPESTEELSEFVRLQDRNKQTPYELTNGGAIISEKLAILMDVEPGDELVIRDDEEMKYTIPIQSVTENYTGHYLYLTTKLYEDIFSEKYVPNTDLLLYEEDRKWEDNFASKVMDESQVAVVTFIDTIDRAFADTLESLDVITLVLIISAAALAFVVLYNLTNINVSERIRELSTIKVLGFYDLEVSMYIYRETFILTLLGIFFGFILGSVLSGVVLKMVEVDFMLFPVTILPLSYLYSALLSMVFSAVVMIIMHRKLKKVDMIEALKSVE